MKVCEGARGLEGPIVIVDGELLPPRHGSPHLGGIRLGTDSSNLPSSSDESRANRVDLAHDRPALVRR